jgi:hypothetical protein
VLHDDVVKVWASKQRDLSCKVLLVMLFIAFGNIIWVNSWGIAMFRAMFMGNMITNHQIWRLPIFRDTQFFLASSENLQRSQWRQTHSNSPPAGCDEMLDQLVDCEAIVVW